MSIAPCSPTSDPSIAVLVVDDDAAVRNALKFALESEGFQVGTYENASALLVETEPPGPSCLVLDYRMPSIDGLQLFEMLRDRGWNVPTILITAHANGQLRRTAEQLGIDRVLEKPLSNGDLADEIRQLLET